MLPFNLRKAITEPEKVIAPIATPSPISTRLTWRIPSGLDDPEGVRVEEGGRADQHRRHADQRVEGGDQLRHGRHLDAARGDQADAAADHDGDGDFRRVEAMSWVASVVTDRDRHADHAGTVAALAGGRARQAAQAR